MDVTGQLHLLIFIRFQIYHSINLFMITEYDPKTKDRLYMLLRSSDFF